MNLQPLRVIRTFGLFDNFFSKSGFNTLVTKLTVGTCLQCVYMIFYDHRTCSSQWSHHLWLILAPKKGSFTVRTESNATLPGNDNTEPHTHPRCLLHQLYVQFFLKHFWWKTRIFFVKKITKFFIFVIRK